jgi:hypothetical protein
VELHGGRIEAKSEGLNQGSEFVVCLPAIGAQTAEAQQALRSESESQIGRRVLIADDNHDAAVSLSMLLQAMGHETRIARWAGGGGRGGGL